MRAAARPRGATGPSGGPGPERGGGRASSFLARVDRLLPGQSLRRLWDRGRSVFWVLPSVCVLLAIALGASLVVLDQHLGRISDAFLYPGPPAGARIFLSSIITGMVTFTGMVFSVSIVVLQLTNGQFSSRVVRIYLRDLTVQLTLGMCLASFVYAMVVLRSIRGSQGQGGFVPRIAVTVAFALVVASVALFIRYIAHISNMVRVATIIRVVGGEARHVIDQRCPLGSRAVGPPPTLPPPVGTVESDRPGVLVSLNEEHLVELAAGCDCVLAVVLRVGDFVPAGALLCRVHPALSGNGAPGLRNVDALAALADQVRRSAGQDTERTTEQDLAFGFRQLVDIAERALSPSVNDPTTASQCLDALHDLLRRLAVRDLPDGVHRDERGTVRLLVPQYWFEDLLDLALAEIWHYGTEAAQVRARITAILEDLEQVARPSHRLAVLRWQERVTASSAT